MPSRGHGLAVVVTLVLLSSGLAAAAVAGSAWAQTTTTSTTAPTTTTTSPTTTTTVPPTTAATTTTTAPTTTTSHVHLTTTTTHPPTTTTSTHTAATSSSTPWGWIILAVVLALAVLLVILLIARTRRQGREADWRRLALPAVTAAELARELVLSQSPTDDEQRRANVGVQVEDAAGGLERAADSAPDEERRALCTRCAESLRGLAFAVEADHLMRHGGQHPTGEQLASADVARRNRLAELDENLAELKAEVTPAEQGAASSRR
jgi:hypothetical protein